MGRGFYFACVMNCYSELFVAERHGFGCNFWDREGRKQLTPKIVQLSVSVLAVVTSEVKTTLYMYGERDCMCMACASQQP